jgi:hypothetical protein
LSLPPEKVPEHSAELFTEYHQAPLEKAIDLGSFAVELTVSMIQKEQALVLKLLHSSVGIAKYVTGRRNND